jgi:hypothetical protein
MQNVLHTEVLSRWRCRLIALSHPRLLSGFGRSIVARLWVSLCHLEGVLSFSISLLKLKSFPFPVSLPFQPFSFSFPQFSPPLHQDLSLPFPLSFLSVSIIAV